MACQELLESPNRTCCLLFQPSHVQLMHDNALQPSTMGSELLNARLARARSHSLANAYELNVLLAPFSVAIFVLLACRSLYAPPEPRASHTCFLLPTSASPFCILVLHLSASSSCT